jgi:hypothetical protein
MNINKLVHETRGKCWHEVGTYEHDVQKGIKVKVWTCKKCGKVFYNIDSIVASCPDYENDMNACMELWGGNKIGLLNVDEDGIWHCCYRQTHSRFTLYVKAETPQLAICQAYLKSKGVELGEDK